MDTKDPFAQYVRKPAPAEDPFAAYERKADPFAQYVRQEPKEKTDTSIVEQVVKGATTPFFGGESQKFSPEVTRQARELLKKQGYEADSLTDSALTGIMSLADTLSFGNLSEIKAALSNTPEEVHEAALQIRQEEQPWSATAGNIGGYILPAVATGGLGAVARFGVPAAQALFVGAEKAEEGKTAEGIARAASEEILSLGIGKLIGNAITGAKGLRTDKAIKNSLLDEGLGSEQADLIIKKVNTYKKHYNDTIKSVKQLDDAQAKEFERLILGGKSIDEYPYEDLGEALDQYKDLISKRQAVFEESGLEKSKAAFLGMKMMDAQYVGNMIDRRYGTEVMSTMNEVSRDFNKGLWAAKGMKQQAKNMIEDVGIKSTKDSSKIIEDIEAGGGPEEVKNLFENLRKQANEMYGEEVISKRKNYIPHYTKRIPEVIAVLRNKVKEVAGKTPGTVRLEDIESIRSDKELMDSLKYIGGYGGQKENLLNDDALLTLVRTLNHSSKTKEVMDIAARSVKERLTEDIPDLIREKDLGRLLGGWIDSVTADASMRKNLRKINSDAEALSKVDPTASAYLRNYVTDVSGGSRAVAGWARSKMNSFTANQLEKALDARGNNNSVKAYFHEAAAELPQFMQYAQAQLYPYFLGLRVDAVVRNLTQPYLLTLPEIGGNAAYRTKLIMESIPQSISGMFTGNKINKKVFEELANKGWLPPDPTPGQFQQLRKGIESGGAIKKGSKKFLEMANTLAMIGYQQSDLANRVVTLSVGKRLAKDIIKGNKDALTYVQKLPPSYRRQVTDALKSGDNELVQDRVLDHLMATTQFNYNRASMSEYGREMGSAFSQFSKWPTAIGADIFDGYDAAKFEKLKGGTRLPSNTRRVLTKYLAPYMMLSGANAVFFGEEGPTERQKQVFGADLAGSSPLSSITAPMSDPGRAFTPPVYQAVKEFVQGDSVDTTFGLLPLATYGKFYTEKLPAWMENERGQKPTEALNEIIPIKDTIRDIKEEIIP